MLHLQSIVEPGQSLTTSTRKTCVIELMPDKFLRRVEAVDKIPERFVEFFPFSVEGFENWSLSCSHRRNQIRGRLGCWYRSTRINNTNCLVSTQTPEVGAWQLCQGPSLHLGSGSNIDDEVSY